MRATTVFGLLWLAGCGISKSPIQKCIEDFYGAIEARDVQQLKRMMKPGELITFELNGVVYRKAQFLQGIADGTLVLNESVDMPDYETRSGLSATLKVLVKNRDTGSRKVRLFHLRFGTANWEIDRVEEQPEGFH